MVSLGINLSHETRLYVQFMILVLFLLTLSITALTCVLWRNGQLQALARCDCHRTEKRKER